MDATSLPAGYRPRPMQPEPVPTASLLHNDLPCVKCRYNLRTLPINGNCPECGHAVADSLRAEQLRRTELGGLRNYDPAWLKAMERGLRLAWIAWVASLVGLFYGVVNPPYTHNTVPAILWTTPLVVVYILSCWAAWILAAPWTIRFWTPVVRIAIAGSVASLGLLYLNSQFAYYYLSRHHMYHPIWKHIPDAGIVLTVLMPLATAATFFQMYRIGRLARRRELAGFLAIFGSLNVISAGMLSFVHHAERSPFYASAGELVSRLGPTGSAPAGWILLVGVYKMLSRQFVYVTTV